MWLGCNALNTARSCPAACAESMQKYLGDERFQLALQVGSRRFSGRLCSACLGRHWTTRQHAPATGACSRSWVSRHPTRSAPPASLPPPPLPPLPQVGLGMTVREGPEEAASAAGGQQQEDTATSGGAGAAEPPAAAAAGSAPEPMQQDGAQPPAAAEPEPERSEEEWELLNK